MLARVYPNPVADVLRIEITGGFRGGATVTVHDLPGRIVARQASPGDDVSLAVDQLPAGRYFVRIRVGDYVETQLIVKRWNDYLLCIGTLHPLGPLQCASDRSPSRCSSPFS